MRRLFAYLTFIVLACNSSTGGSDTAEQPTGETFGTSSSSDTPTSSPTSGGWPGPDCSAWSCSQDSDCPSRLHDCVDGFCAQNNGKEKPPICFPKASCSQPCSADGDCGGFGAACEAGVCFAPQGPPFCLESPPCEPWSCMAAVRGSCPLGATCPEGGIGACEDATGAQICEPPCVLVPCGPGLPACTDDTFCEGGVCSIEAPEGNIRPRCEVPCALPCESDVDCGNVPGVNCAGGVCVDQTGNTSPKICHGVYG